MDPKTTEKQTILLVDDEEAIRRFLGPLLESYGYQVLQAENGKQALAVAENHHGPIHLLISDVVMPELDGPKLAKQLRAVRPDILVILMSGYAVGLSVLNRDWIFIQKPFQVDAFIKIVRDLLA
jgi:DNA-binding NtrC family response regulator